MSGGRGGNRAYSAFSHDTHPKHVEGEGRRPAWPPQCGSPGRSGVDSTGGGLDGKRQKFTADIRSGRAANPSEDREGDAAENSNKGSHVGKHW